MTSFLNYFLTSDTPFNSWGVTAGLILAAVLFFSGLILPFLGGRFLVYRSIVPSLANLFRISGLVFALLFFLRNQGIAPFMARGWAYGGFLIFLAILGWILRGYRRVAPGSQREAVLTERYRQYLPQKKRRA